MHHIIETHFEYFVTAIISNPMYATIDSISIQIKSFKLRTLEHVRRHHLERSFLVDSEEAVAEADVIGVLHDAANKYTKFFLDPKIQRILYMHQRKHTFLILNKVRASNRSKDYSPV